MKCAILDDYQRVSPQFFEDSSLTEQSNPPKLQLDYFHEAFAGTQQVTKALEPYDIIVAMRERTRFPAEVLSRLPNLKLLVTSGMRNLAIDVPFARAKGIVVSGTSSYKEPPTELAWALILGLARHIVAENSAFKSSGPWQSTVGTTLHGKTLGLLGLGKIGQNMARIGQAFGMKVMAWSQNLTQQRCVDVGVAFAPTKTELLESSDFVSVHLVLSERTRGLIKMADIKAMKPSAYLINTSRAAIVDQQDLITALQQKFIAGAGLDVFEQEPLPAGHSFRTLDNVLATPHLGYVADKNYQAYFGEAIENIEAFLAGAPIRELS